nr:hypothetical protein [Tanacetum cinerariifolium]
MPSMRNRPLTEAYEQEFKQRVMARIEERLDQFVDQVADRMKDMMNPRRRGDRNGQGSKGEELENPTRVNIPKFHGNTLNPEGFIDWLVAVEEVFEFKEGVRGVKSGAAGGGRMGVVVVLIQEMVGLPKDNYKVNMNISCC